MRNRTACLHLVTPLYYGFEQKNFCPHVKEISLPTAKDLLKRHRHMLVNMTLYLILFWTIGAIVMISMRQGERSIEEIVGRQAIITELLPVEKLANR